MIFASDLDRTLIYSSEFIQGMEDDRYRIVEWYQGRPISFLSEQTLQGLCKIAQLGLLLPVTTRSIEQYQRVMLRQWVPCPYAVTSNGGTVLVDGKPDIYWDQLIRRQLEDTSENQAIVGDFLGRQAEVPGVLKFRSVESLFHYYVIDETRLEEGWIKGIEAYLNQIGWILIKNGRKLYCMPNGLEKSKGIQRVMELTGKHRVVAAGDSVMDLSMASVSERFLTPGHGDKALLGHNICRLNPVGMAGGDEIVEAVFKMILKENSFQ